MAFNSLVQGGTVKKTRFYCLGSAKYHQKVSMRTMCAAKFNNFFERSTK